jgi:hypothetical protein
MVVAQLGRKWMATHLQVDEATQVHATSPLLTEAQRHCRPYCSDPQGLLRQGSIPIAHEERDSESLGHDWQHTASTELDLIAASQEPPLNPSSRGRGVISTSRDWNPELVEEDGHPEHKHTARVEEA